MLRRLGTRRSSADEAIERPESVVSTVSTSEQLYSSSSSAFNTPTRQQSRESLSHTATTIQPSQISNFVTPPNAKFPFANEMLSPSTLNYSSNTPFNVQEHLTREMFGWGKPGTFNPPAKENITNFLLVPYELECFLLLGLCVCIDSFIYMLSFLPLRVFLGCLSLLQELVLIVCQRLFNVKIGGNVGFLPRFHRTQAFDLMRGLMLIIAIAVLRLFRMSEWYHFIRGQGVIKLYVLTSMIEVLDKLLSCLGQDIFDALHRQVRRHPLHWQTVGYFIASTVYVCLHACMYFFQVATYMVSPFYLSIFVYSAILAQLS